MENYTGRSDDRWILSSAEMKRNKFFHSEMYNFRENQISNIRREYLKCLTVSLKEENVAVKECLEILLNCLKDKTADKVTKVLERLNSEFDKNFDSRIYASQIGAYHVMLRVLLTFDDESKIVRLGLKNMIRLTGCQSIPLNEEGIIYQMDLLKREKELYTVQLLLRWMKQCCIKSEKNREDIFNARVTNELRNILQSEFLSSSKLQDVCSLIRALVLDDDPEFDYGNSVERTREIANCTLGPMTVLLDSNYGYLYVKILNTGYDERENEVRIFYRRCNYHICAEFKRNKKAVCQILQTLLTLLIRNEFFKKIEVSGGLDFILQAMRSFPDDENLNCLIMMLVKALTLNDDVKVRLVSQGAAPLVLAAMSRIQTGAMAVAGLGCIAALTLKSPGNSRIFYDCEAPRLIIETMKRYPGSMNVQRYGARTISNMAMKNEVGSKVFCDYEAETFLEIAMKIHGDEVEDCVKAAFFHLGLNPELKDHWMKIPQWIKSGKEK